MDPIDIHVFIINMHSGSIPVVSDFRGSACLS
jgi:hypothetical protein